MVSLALEKEITLNERLDITSIHSVFQDVKPFVDSLQSMISYSIHSGNVFLTRQLIQWCKTEAPTGMVPKTLSNKVYILKFTYAFFTGSGCYVRLAACVYMHSCTSN